MHMKGIITNDWTLLGSYNFSIAARYKNWEQLLCARSNQVDRLWFDALWGNLVGRDIDYGAMIQPCFEKKEATASWPEQFKIICYIVRNKFQINVPRYN